MWRWILMVWLGFSGAAPGAAERGILVFGDSLSAAYGIEPEQGWVALLGERLAQSHPEWWVRNASISGETSHGGRNRLPALLVEYRPQVLILELGANDGLRGLSLEALGDNLEAMVVEAQAAGARVLMLGMELPPNYGKRYTQAFAATQAEVAARHGLAWRPFFLEGVSERDDWMQADRLHPNAAGQARLLENVWPLLEPLLTP